METFREELSRYSDGLRAWRPRFGSWQGQEIVLHSTASRLPLGLALSPGGKRPESESDHSPSSNAEVKNNAPIPPLHIRLHTLCLIKHRDFILLHFTSVIQSKRRDSILNYMSRSLFPYPCKFIIHWLSCHSILYNMSYWRRYQTNKT
jgi:hypothetical protein